MAEITALLQQLGFSEYEARAYLALVQRNPINGYELAKVSGLPRANVYAVLQKLEERGAVVRLDMASGARYAPVPPAELTQRIASRFQDTLSAAQRALEELATPPASAHVWSIQGYGALLEHAHTLIDATGAQLLVAIGRQEAGTLAGALARAEARGVAVTTLCLDTCPEECGGCRGTICRSCVIAGEGQHWLVLVADEAETLAGEIGRQGDVMGVRTRQQLQVNLASWYIRHSIALTAVLGELSRRQGQALEPETRALLEAADAPHRQGGWLDQLRTLLRRNRPSDGTPAG